MLHPLLRGEVDLHRQRFRRLSTGLVSSPWRREERDGLHWGGDRPEWIVTKTAAEDQSERQEHHYEELLVADDDNGNGIYIPERDFGDGDEGCCCCCCVADLFKASSEKRPSDAYSMRRMLATSAAAMQGAIGTHNHSGDAKRRRKTRDERIVRALRVLRDVKMRAIMAERLICIPPRVPSRPAVQRKKDIYFASDLRDPTRGPPFVVPRAFALVLRTGLRGVISDTEAYHSRRRARRVVRFREQKKLGISEQKSRHKNQEWSKRERFKNSQNHIRCDTTS